MNGSVPKKGSGMHITNATAERARLLFVEKYWRSEILSSGISLIRHICLRMDCTEYSDSCVVVQLRAPLPEDVRMPFECGGVKIFYKYNGKVLSRPKQRGRSAKHTREEAASILDDLTAESWFPPMAKISISTVGRLAPDAHPNVKDDICFKVVVYGPYIPTNQEKEMDISQQKEYQSIRLFVDDRRGPARGQR